MKAKMLNQIIQIGKETLTKYEKKSGRNLDRDMWSTVYITDIPIQILTKEATVTIQDFIDRHFDDKEVEDFTMERNGMLGFWQFTVITFQEVTEFDITEEPDKEHKAELMQTAEDWWEQDGSESDKYKGLDWWIKDVKELENGNRIDILLECEFGTQTETVITKENGELEWIEDEN